ncbi:uncharacterized protein LOC143286518 isoform X2 [Babylonia areolata]|uniref:uncharacterized protein LOC143286518 isoform X2 n=1 Tax=Babylonia areolata TaxID=304850 RepID=UPI003FD5270D
MLLTIAAAAVCARGTNRMTVWTSAKKVMTLWMVVWAVTYIPGCGGTVTCNAYDTCLPARKQVNLTDSIRNGHKQQVCVIVSAAMRCLEEARRDCDDAGYENLPDFIVQGLEEKRKNMTSYIATYCGTNGGDVRGVSVTATVGWALLLSAFLSRQ